MGNSYSKIKIYFSNKTFSCAIVIAEEKILLEKHVKQILLKTFGQDFNEEFSWEEKDVLKEDFITAGNKFYLYSSPV